MKLDSLEQHWNALGEEDPLWAILSDPTKRGRAWDLAEFLATARSEVADLFAELEGRGIKVQHGRALDFGCGVGRLTQELARHFDSCDGVDVAPSMIDGAVRLNQQGDRCRFHYNPAPDLSRFSDQSFDFILSLLVFQHMEPYLMKNYLREFVRVLRVGGIAYFNIPDRYLPGTDLEIGALRASLALAGSLPLPTLKTRQVLALKVEVRNQGEFLWPASARLNVGNHWLAADGEMLVRDDARAPIEQDLASGAADIIELPVVAPDAAGQYLLEVDVVQEHRGWFSEFGSRTLRIPVTVAGEDDATSPGPAGRPGAGAEQILIPRIEMHVLTREETVAVIEEAGGIVLDVIARDRCGPSVPSLDYVVARNRGSASTTGETVPGQDTERPASAAAPLSRVVAEDLWHARARLEDRAELASFRLTSKRSWLGAPSVILRAFLRRALLEVLHRQTEFNRASRTLIRELEGRTQRLQGIVEAQAETLAATEAQLRSLEAAQRGRGLPAQTSEPARPGDASQGDPVAGGESLASPASTQNPSNP